MPQWFVRKGTMMIAPAALHSGSTFKSTSYQQATNLLRWGSSLITGTVCSSAHCKCYPQRPACDVTVYDVIGCRCGRRCKHVGALRLLLLPPCILSATFVLYSELQPFIPLPLTPALSPSHHFAHTPRTLSGSRVRCSSIVP